MSKEASPAFVIEWSSSGARVFDPLTSSTRSFPTFAAAAQAAKGASRVIVAVSRRAAFVRAIRVPDAPKEDVRQALLLTGGAHLPLPIAEMSFDVSLTEDTGIEGRLAILGAIVASDLHTINSELRLIGIKEFSVIPVAFGAAALGLKSGMKDGAVVERLEDGWAIDILSQGELKYSRLAPARVTEQQIEDEVTRTFAAAGMTCGEILVAGGLELPFADHRTRETALEALSQPEFALFDFHLELQEEAAAKKAKARATKLRLASLVLASCVLIAYFIYDDRAKVQAEIAKTTARLAVTDRRIKADVSDVKAAQLSADAMNADLDRAFKPAQRASDMIQVVANAAPTGVWLTNITVERGRPVLVRGSAMTSDAITAFVNALNGSPRLRDARIVFTNNGSIDRQAIVQFSVQATAVGNLPLADVATARQSK